MNPRSHENPGENPGNAAIGYVRVTTEEQAAECVSSDAQRAKIAAYCALHGVGLAQPSACPGT